MGRIKFRIISSICVMLLVSQTAYGARFFRYVDDDGRLVLSHTIPNDRVKLGYDIVDENARVMQRIAPQLSKDEYEKQIAKEAALTQCRTAVKRVQSLYRSIADIDYAEDQALESIETQITNTKANLTHLINQRKELEEQAAQLDIAGKQISNSLLENIASAKSQEANLEEQIENRYAEKLEERLAYNLDRNVFGRDDCESGS
ncbi:MAG: putative metalloendopeptidase [Candidatus Azotimanducaceae bacterium]|jgi:predicted metalloendopeptidase